MARYLGRRPIGYDDRTGRKVRHSDLVEDGENPAIRVHRRERDTQHPSKYPRPIGADRIALRRPAPEKTVQPVRVMIGYDADISALGAGRMGTIQLPLSVGMASVESDEGVVTV